MWPCSTWRIKIAARPLYHCPQQIHRSLSQCWRTEDLLGEGNRFKQRALFYSPTFKSCKTYCKVSGWKGGSLALKRSLLYPCHLRSRFIMLYYKSVHRSPIQLAYQILYGQIVNGLSELEIREFTELVMIHDKRVYARCVLPASL